MSKFKLIGGGVFAGILGLVLLDSTYVVDSGQVAYVRVNGNANKAEIVRPGRHLAYPFISKIDRINVTQNNVHLDTFQVKTVDNQSIGLKINVTYDVPEASAYHILYEIGVPGDADIADNISPIVKDRARQVLATRNTTSLSKESGEVQAEITRVVHDELNRLFQVHVASLQIEQFIYSPAFEESNNNAVLAKNKAILEENNKYVVQYQADQKVLAAKLNAEAAQKWNGGVPAYIVSDKSASTFMPLRDFSGVAATK